MNHSLKPIPPNIIYTDIEPDFSSENIDHLFELDLNNDDIVDFTLSISPDIYEWLGISAISNGGIISVTPWYTNIVPLERGKEIFNLRGNTSGEIYKSGGIITSGDCNGNNEESNGCYYDWSGKNDRFLGLRINLNGQTHYGWARLSVKSPTEWLVSDYAYNATPDSPIIAGQIE